MKKNQKEGPSRSGTVAVASTPRQTSGSNPSTWWQQRQEDQQETDDNNVLILWRTTVIDKLKAIVVVNFKAVV
jgi:hypothetical protein